ncbi:hypothetical protein [Wenjunlia vitaminophila]|uniref:hypothetical protein n=1 Tax=Wenjunlia vitaminophila TaxID=76728 RepID=UPI00037A941F|nr:hypothetical protein [Wenjunlia vitaminophila]
MRTPVPLVLLLAAGMAVLGLVAAAPHTAPSRLAMCRATAAGLIACAYLLVLLTLTR